MMAAHFSRCVTRPLRRCCSTGSSSLAEVLAAVATGSLSPDAARMRLGAEYETVGDYARIDHSREARTGLPEAVFAEGKTPEQVVAILRSIRDRGSVALATRVDVPLWDAIVALDAADGSEDDGALRYHADARIATLTPSSLPEIPHEKRGGKVVVVCAGTTDLPVAEEAAITCELYGFDVDRVSDVGVAGIHRLVRNAERIGAADVAICVAGMDGALFSALGGLVKCPLVAVPTSVGYGTAFGGISPLLGALNACSAGVGVVNIDNGFGAATLAARIVMGGTRRVDEAVAAEREAAAAAAESA